MTVAAQAVKEKNVRVQLRLSPETARLLELGARRDGVSRSEYVERSLYLYDEVSHGREVEAPMALAVASMEASLADWTASMEALQKTALAATDANLAVGRFLAHALGVGAAGFDEVVRAYEQVVGESHG